MDELQTRADEIAKADKASEENFEQAKIVMPENLFNYELQDGDIIRDSNGKMFRVTVLTEPLTTI